MTRPRIFLLTADGAAEPSFSDAVDVVRSERLEDSKPAGRADECTVIAVGPGAEGTLRDVLAHARCPVVVIVETPRPRDAVAAVRAGAVDYTDLAGAEAACLAAAPGGTTTPALFPERMADQHLAGVGRLAGGVAHEINNPAAFVMTNLEEISVVTAALDRLIHEALPLARASATPAQLERLEVTVREAFHPTIHAEIQQMVDECREGMRRIRDVVQDFRGFSREEDEQQGLVDLASVTDAPLLLLKPELRNHARLSIDLQSVPLVQAAPGRLQQVVLHILLNTLQRMQHFAEDERGNIEINTKVRPQSDRREIGVLEIRDNAEPLPRALWEPRLDPLSLPQEHDRQQALRLRICHTLLAAQGGNLSLRVEDGWTVAEICFPIGREISTDGDGFVRVDPLEQAHILVVDNEPAIGRAIRRLLRGARHVHIATSGKEALTILFGDDPPDLILCDLIMPRYSGMDLYEDVLKANPALAARFLFITGGPLSESGRAFTDRHSERVVHKPFDPEELRTRIRKELETMADD